MMSRSPVSLSFLLGCSVGADFFTYFKKADAAVKQVAQSSASLNRTAGQVQSYQKLQSSIVANQAAMINYSGTLCKLNGILVPQTDKEVKLLAVSSERLQRKLDADRESLARLRSQLVAAGVERRSYKSKCV